MWTFECFHVCASCTLCGFIAHAARVYQSILTSSTLPLRGAVTGFDANLMWVAALGCSPDRCRRMSTHNTDSLLQARLYGTCHSFLWAAHYTGARLAVTYWMCITTFPQTNHGWPTILSLQIQTGKWNTMSIMYSIIKFGFTYQHLDDS